MLSGGCCRARPAPLLAAWDRGEVDAVTASSSEAVDNLVELLGTARLAGKPLFVNHPRVAERARKAGMTEVVVSAGRDDETAEALVAYFGSRMEDAQPENRLEKQQPEKPSARRSRTTLLLLSAIVLAAALATVFWLDARQRIGATQQELARRLRDIEADAREARTVARQSEEAQRETRLKLGQLEARLAESQSQQLALEALYQELSRNRDEWQLAEIEQVLAIASAAAAARRQRARGAARAAARRGAACQPDRPQFVPIRRALARDIERLKTLPALDLAGMTMRIDGLVAQVDSLPLAFDERSERGRHAKEAARDDERGFWSRLGRGLERAAPAVVVRAGRQPGAAAAAAVPGLLRAREPAAAPAQRAPVAPRARRGGIPRGPAHRAAWIQRYFDPRSKQPRRRSTS